MGETEEPQDPHQSGGPVLPPVQIQVDQQLGSIGEGGQAIGVSIGQMSDAIIHIQERALTAEAAQRPADIELEMLAQGVRGLAQASSCWSRWRISSRPRGWPARTEVWHESVVSMASRQSRGVEPPRPARWSASSWSARGSSSSGPSCS